MSEATTSDWPEEAPPEDRLTRIEKLILDPPADEEQMVIEVAMIVWECDRRTAATRLGVIWRRQQGRSG